MHSSFEAQPAALQPSQQVAAIAAPAQPGHLTRDIWWGSAGALVAATSLDAATSWGHLEGNSFLASSNGEFGAKGLTLKLVGATAVLAPQFLLRRHTKLLRIFAIANGTEAAMYTGVAIHNLDITSR